MATVFTPWLQEAIKAQSKPSAQYVTNQNGQTTSQYTSGNSTYNVAKDSVFDPLSKNYNAQVANSGGTISLSGPNGSAGSGATAYSAVAQLTPQQIYAQQQSALAAQVAQQAAAAKKLALTQAWEGNKQALNSQNATVDNNFQSAKNNLGLLKSQQLPQYQQQKDSTSSDAAAMARRTEALNALSGKYFSGTNRSQQLAIDLGRQNALQGIQGAQNNFTTTMDNKLSEADSARVAALNDIAGKLALGAKQLNDGTYSLDNQLQSEIATGALKASIDAQTWADQQKQLGVENTFRQAQLDQAANIAKIQQAFQEKQLTAEQANQAIAQEIQRAQLLGTLDGQPTLAAQSKSADEAYRNASLAADTAYKNAALAKSSSDSSSPSVTELNYQDKQSAAQNTSQAMDYLNKWASGEALDDDGTKLGRATRDGILAWVNQHAGELNAQGVDVNRLFKWADTTFQWNPS